MCRLSGILYEETLQILMNMLILNGCEESQAVTIAMRERGHTAYSCDLMKCSGGHPEWHLQMDVFKAIYFMNWDRIILFPPCTKVAVSGNGTYAGTQERMQAATWTQELFKQACNVCNSVAFENPVGVLNTLFPWLPKPQYVDLWWFGTKEMKKTGFWKRGLPDLKPTNIVGPPPEDPKERIKWQKTWMMSPSENRGILRSKLDPNLADAIASQWA